MVGKITSNEQEKNRKTSYPATFSRGGSNDENNLLTLTEKGHQSFHTIFGFKTFLEAAAELRKWDITQDILENDFINCQLFQEAYRNIFDEMDFISAAQFLEEIDNRKRGK